MSRKVIVAMACAWVLSLVSVGVWAQARVEPGVALVTPKKMGDPVGPVITAENIGFQRIAAQSEPGKVVGKWMVNVNGVWFETQSPVGITKIAK